MPNLLKPKVLAILFVMIAAPLASAAPASAWWEATGQQSKGQVKFISGARFRDGSFSAECWNPNEIHGTWSIQAPGQIKGKQLQAKRGPDLLIQIKSWEGFNGACIRMVFLSKLTVTIPSCEFRLTQPKESLVATFGFVNPCAFKDTSGCTVQHPAGMEKGPESNEGINVGLKQIKLENKETKSEVNQFDKALITGIRASSNCEFAETDEGEWEFPAFELAGIKAV